MHFLLIILIVWIMATIIPGIIRKETAEPTGQVSTGAPQLHPYQRQQQELKTMEWFKNGGLRNQ